MYKTLALIVAGLFFATPTFALDDYTQHNFTASKDNLSVTVREHDGLDKWMGQIDYKFSGWGYGYRYQESKGDVEHRLRLNAPTLVKFYGVSVTPRVEYRSFDKSSKDDFTNVWLRIQYKHNITENLSGYIKIQPKFSFGYNKFDDGRFYESQNNIGFDYKLPNGVTIGIFGEKNYDEHLERKDLFLGTNVSVKF